MTAAVTGATRVAAIIGDPVEHSRSPAIWNAAFAATGLDWVFVALPVPRGQVPAAMDGVRTLGIAALSVTMPHKMDAARACDELTPTATRLGAVNSVLTRDGRLLGDSTDGEGLVRALVDEGCTADGQRCVVLGAGGAARAIVFALGAAGAQVTVAARRVSEAESAAGLAPDGEACDLAVATDAVAAATIVINATPVGMQGEAPAFDPSVLGTDHVVIDTIYPAETPLVVAARAQGARATNGLGMLVHQAALSFVRFTGVDAPLEVMRAAASTS
ncbi:MAG: shikimate dehydrogenase [Acidimicrobiia bacterium]|nr:shikimate dehydrogenase [Acidimicrobiia bacterium]